MPDPVTLQRGMRRIAERRIRVAIAAGELDDLPGMGRPIPGIDRPYDPMWWIKSWLRRERLDEESPAGDPRYRKLAAFEELRAPASLARAAAAKRRMISPAGSIDSTPATLLPACQ